MASLNKSILRPSGLTALDIDKFLSGTAMQGLGANFITAEAESGIGADYLLAIACHESGKGTGPYTKAPYRNLFSWGIMDSGPRPEGQFASFAQCISVVPKQLGTILSDLKNWRNVAAAKKGFVPQGLQGMNTWYASDTEWAAKVEGWRLSFIKTLDQNKQAMFWASDVGMYNTPTSPDQPVTRLMLAYAMRKLGGV